MKVIDELASAWRYLDVAHSARVPIWNERRVVGEARAARKLPPPEPAEQDFDILVVHGFLDDGRNTRRLISRLCAAGHRVHSADIGRNVDCGEKMLQRLIDELQLAAERAGGPVVLIGHSRGGSLSRAAAVRYPDLVAGVITLGSPLAEPNNVTLMLKLIKLGMRELSALGVRGLMGECADGECCGRYRADLTGPFPSEVPLVSIYSPTDGMVGATAPQDPSADLIEVDATHAGLTFAPAALAAIDEALASLKRPRHLHAVADA